MTNKTKDASMVGASKRAMHGTVGVLIYVDFVLRRLPSGVSYVHPTLTFNKNGKK